MNLSNEDWKRIGVAALVVAALLVALFTGLRLSNVLNDLDETLESPLVGYLPDEIKARIDWLQAEWQELEPLVRSIEDIVDALSGMEEQGVSNFDSLGLSDTHATRAILSVDQLGAGPIVEFKDGGSTIWQLADGGAVTYTGDQTVNGRLIVDGAADAVQMTVQGHSTQTSNLLVAETSAGTDLFWVTGDGDMELNGTTPTLTLGDAGAENAGVVLDGNAQDFYLALVDATDDLVVGLGNAFGTTGILFLDENQDVGIGAASAGSKLSVTGNGLFDGAADEVQLTIQGHSTQNAALLTLETSAGTDMITMTAAGAVNMVSASATGAIVAEQLTSTDNAWIVGDLTVDGSVGVTGTVTAEQLTSTDNAWIVGDLTVDGGVGVTGTVSAEQLISTDDARIDDDLTVTGQITGSDDVNISSANGNNAGARVEYIGLPRLKWVDVAQGTNPAGDTVDCMDANPTGEWTEVDAATNLVVTADTTYYRYDTNSVKLAVTTVAENDGVSAALPAQDDLTDIESVGFWIYSDEALVSGDLDLTVDDSDGTDQVYTIGAVPANVWTWVEVDVSGCNANCDTTDNFIILFTAQGAVNLTDPDIYIDELFFWDAADEETLGVDLVLDGVITVLTIPTAAGTNNTLAIPVEWTDYIVHYESGNDFIVWITDQSANEVLVQVAYQ